MKKYLVFTLSLVGYTLSITSLTYMILWLYPWSFMPYSVDNPMIKLNFNPFVVDTSLILLFGLQHSLMARGFFKEKVVKKLHDSAKISLYAISSSFAIALILIFWQPIDGTLWKFDSGFWYIWLTTLYIVGWVVAFVATFMIDHFGLFGLSQGYRYLKGVEEPKSEFKVSYFYKFVRHPIQAGTMVGMIATPVMSYSHLLFSIGMSIYIVIGLYFEERSLIEEFGDSYLEYKKTTPMLFPKV